MKFIATDGTVFEKRSEYRKYEMETQYSFRNKQNETLTKHPKSINGQPFEITSCQKCTIHILDHCDQVQIDHTSKTKVFIGASSESIFVRNCQHCTFTIACKQLRTRDCKDCTFYLYCKTEPIIETSVNIKFAPFNGAYPSHEKDMSSANLNPKLNLWFKIYDFNDESNTTCDKNWRYLTREEEDTLWCPLGPAENCCPRIDAEQVKTGNAAILNGNDSTIASLSNAAASMLVCKENQKMHDDSMQHIQSSNNDRYYSSGNSSKNQSTTNTTGNDKNVNDSLCRKNWYREKLFAVPRSFSSFMERLTICLASFWKKCLSCFFLEVHLLRHGEKDEITTSHGMY